MPSIEEVEQFKNVLNELGDEPEILAERDEEIEDVLPPDQGLPAGLGDLLESPEGGAEEQQEPFPEAPSGQEVDLSDLFGDEDLSGLDVLEGLELPEGEAQAEEPVAEAGEEAPEIPEAPFEPAAGEDEFGIPPELLEPSAAEAEESAAPEEDFELPAGPEAGEAAEEMPFDLSEFEMPTEEAPEPGSEEPFEEEAAEEAAPAAEEALSAEELPEMPGFDIEGFDEEAFAAPEGEEEAPVAPAAPGEGEAFGETEFELPEEFALPEEQIVEEGVGEQLAQEGAPEPEVPAEPSEEEAEFLRVLQDQILPEGEAAAEQPAEGPPAGEVFEEFGEIPLEEAAPGAEAPPEQPTEQGAQAVFPEGEQVDLEAPAGLPEGAEEYELDEFSLEGLGEPFGGEEVEAPPPAPEAIPAEAPGIEEQFPEEIAIPGAGDLTFTDKQFAAIKRTLSRLPRNLKIAVEELIAEKRLEGEELRSLLALLIDGAAPTAIAERVSGLTGRRIVVPKVFERLTGVAFEERRRTFAYAFRENILPILRVVFLSLAVLAILGGLGYFFVYKPLYANYLYRQGYSQIEKERYRMANDTFDKAADVREIKRWFYRYAQGFTGEQQFQLAAEKYEQLLQRFPGDRQGKIAYASLLTNHLAGYERADELLGEVLAKDMKDYDALLARGDNYLEWAEEDESRYEDARFAYASIIDYYGEKDEVLMRMLRYFIRTQKLNRPGEFDRTEELDRKEKLDQTLVLQAYLEGKRKLRVEPQLYASVYAELAGYWIDSGHYDSVPNILFKAMDQKMDLPDIHYQLARYYRYVNDLGNEETALETAIELLERMQPLDKRHLFWLIDSYNRRGKTFWRREEYVEAEQYFQKAIARIQDAQELQIFGRLSLIHI